MDGSYECCSEAAAWLGSRLGGLTPRVGLVCGSGLGALAEDLGQPHSVDYSEIPHFPHSTVSGHAGRLVVGLLGSVPCAVLQGRFHLYEGYSAAQVVTPIRTLHLLGVHTLVLTNAAGGLDPSLQPGQLMVIKDHIDFPGMAGRNPLVGPNDERFGPRFPPMADLYDPELRRLTLALCPPELRAREGVYVGVGGPSYETAAECRMLKRLGADAVGMSTVSEAGWRLAIAVCDSLASPSSPTRLLARLRTVLVTRMKVQKVTKKFWKLLKPEPGTSAPF